MKNYNNRTQNGRSVHPCDHSKTDRLPKKASGNKEQYSGIVHHEGSPCGATVLGSESIGDIGSVNCGKCVKLVNGR